MKLGRIAKRLMKLIGYGIAAVVIYCILHVLIKSTSPAFTPGLNNFRYRLVVEYLINDRGMTIDELIRRLPDYREVEAEVIAGLREDEQAFLKRLGSRIGSSDPDGGA